MLISPLKAIGLERSPQRLKAATLTSSSKGPLILSLASFSPDLPHVKRLYMHHPVLVTGLEGIDVLVRPLTLPSMKENDLKAALPFQAEPLLPYPADQALFTYQILEKEKEEIKLSLLATPKEVLHKHLEAWKELEIEPERVSTVPTALCQFSQTFLPIPQPLIILHVNRDQMTAVLIKQGKLLASFALQEGLSSLLSTQKEDELACLPQQKEEWTHLDRLGAPCLAEAVRKLRQTLIKLSYSLLKELKGERIEGVLLTGEGGEWKGLTDFLMQDFPFPVLQITPSSASSTYSVEEILSYALPIGLALEALSKDSRIDFRQQEFAYPYPWSRLKKPFAASFAGFVLLAFSFYFFSQQYLATQEDHLRQTYADLLGGLNQSFHQVELAFLAKNPLEKERFGGEMPTLKQLNKEDLTERLALLQKDLQERPDSFPLFADIPRVSDVLAWLTQHPAVTVVDEEGNKQARLQIENLSYTLTKRPQHTNKQEKYQVKVELEFSSPTPKWAREFHDALIAPNEWVDPKGEVKWNSSRGKYKTSFFLRDNTYYPS